MDPERRFIATASAATIAASVVSLAAIWALLTSVPGAMPIFLAAVAANAAAVWTLLREFKKYCEDAGR